MTVQQASQDPQSELNLKLAWHAASPQEAVSALATDDRLGLDAAEVLRRRAVYGSNTLPERPPASLVLLFLRQFTSPLIYLLMFAAAMMFVLGHFSDGAVILAVLLLNAVVGAFQEGRAERSLAALRKLAAVRVRVVRGGVEQVVDAAELVPGDVMLVAAGDAVTADARLVEAASLQVAEAALTGESVPVNKRVDAVPAETVLAERRPILHAGTLVTAGRGRALVHSTGVFSELGKTARLAESAEDRVTPLERRLRRFANQIIVAAALLSVAVVSFGLYKGMTLTEVLLIAIAQVVSMVPEGLPVAMTVALAVGVQRMAGRGAIVRRLSAVETLGCTSIICSDKTGTLTKNEMTVVTVVLADGREVAVSGTGYEPEGESRGPDGARLTVESDGGLRELCEAAALCNDSDLEAPPSPGGAWKATGDPTEAALVSLARKAGLDTAALRAGAPRLAEIPFDSSTKLMATAHRAGDREVVMLKGAPEAILELCGRLGSGDDTEPFGEEARAKAQAAAEALAARALRLLAFARVDDFTLEPHHGYADLHGRAVYLGLVGELDPPRQEVAEAVALCRRAGIRAVMVTGDRKDTGLAIARLLGIARDGDTAVDSGELDAMDDAELRRRLPGVSVFARVHPAQKLRIVAAFQAAGGVVAMTGDGVNDAPALATADVGVAMGITGTEAAKSAAKIVITDDNFATIVAAVEEGRLIYGNLKKVILYLFSTSLAEICVLFGAMLLGYPLPLAAVQIIWINLVTDGTVTINLIMERAEGDEMTRTPTPMAEPIVTGRMLERMLFLVPVMAVSVLGYYAWQLSHGDTFAETQTKVFTLMAVCQWFNVLNCRSETRSAFNWGLLRNKWLIGGLLVGNLLHMAVIFNPTLNSIFRTVPISWGEAIAIGLIGSLVLWVEELRKLAVRIQLRRRASTAVPL